MLLVERAGERPLGRGFPQDRKALRAKHRLPFGGRVIDGEMHRGRRGAGAAEQQERSGGYAGGAKE